MSIILKTRHIFVLYKHFFLYRSVSNNNLQAGVSTVQQEKSYIDQLCSQLCSQPPVAAPPPIMCFLFLDVLFLLLYHTVSECLSALQTTAGLLSTESGRVCTLLCIVLLSPYVKEGAAIRMTLVATVRQYLSTKDNSLDRRSVIKSFFFFFE